MNEITYDEWNALFEVSDETAADTDSEISDHPENFKFYSNGAVKCIESEDYVIKCDQVTKKGKR